MSDDILREIVAVEAEIKKQILEKVRLEQMIQGLRQKKDELKYRCTRREIDEQAILEGWMEEYPWHDEIQTILENTFHLKDFRDLQLAAINATIAKRDVIVVMERGTGKSLCYQVPSILESGMTLVISPFISSIEAQVCKLTSLGILAYKLTAGETAATKKAVYDYLIKGIRPDIKFLYVLPDILIKSKRFLSALQTCYELGNFSRIAIDEIHCCSEWSYDLRPDYRFLGVFRTLLSEVPIVGMTATATTFVLNDLRQFLQMSGAIIIQDVFDLTNLYFKVVPKPSKFVGCMELINDIIRKAPKPSAGIIYACSLKECEEIAKSLKGMGSAVCAYHSQMTEEVRTATYSKWMANEYQFIITTATVGLAIERSDIRIVVHYAIPKSVEDLYHQAGKAGRDGKPATCIILYKLPDLVRYMSTVRTQKEIQASLDLLSYLLDMRQCRHAVSGIHCEEDRKKKCQTMCDNCTRSVPPELFHLNRACVEIYNTIDEASKKRSDLTLARLIDSWYKLHSVDISKEDAETVIAHLLRFHILKEERSMTSFNLICYFKKGYEVPPEQGIPVYMANNASLRSYFGPAPEIPVPKKVETDEFSIPSTSKVATEKVGE